MTPEIRYHSRVRVTEAVGELVVGDEGTVISSWQRPMVWVCWDKDGHGRGIHKRRLEIIK